VRREIGHLHYLVGSVTGTGWGAVTGTVPVWAGLASGLWTVVVALARLLVLGAILADVGAGGSRAAARRMAAQTPVRRGGSGAGVRRRRGGGGVAGSAQNAARRC